MSKPGLMFDVGQAEQPRGFLEQVTLLVRVLGAAHEADGVRPVDGHLFVCVAGLPRHEPWSALDSRVTGLEIHVELRRVHLLGGDPGLVAQKIRKTRAIASSQEMSSQWSLPGAR